MPDQPNAMVPSGPEAPTALRDQVIARLSDAFAHGAFDIEELERRVTVAHTARTAVEVEALTVDLKEPASTTALAPRPEPLPETFVEPTGRMLCVMGGARRTGAWTVPRRLKVTTFMGGAELDFRDARLPAGPVDVEIKAMMGGVHVLVPPGLAVEAHGNAVMGGFDQVHRSAPRLDPNAPLLRIRGTAVMGGVQIEMRLPGELSEWEEHARLHQEHQQRRKERRLERRERKALRGRDEG